MKGEAPPETAALVGDFFVGTKDGVPIVREVTDPQGDCRSMEIFADAEDAIRRYHNVRRVRVYIDPEPIRAPESWGAHADE